MSRFIDLSHSVEHGMVTYKGLPGPVISDYLSRDQSRERYAAGTEFQIGKIEMVANTGTYIDSPFHRYAEGADLSRLELESIADVPGVVIHRTTGASAIGLAEVQKLRLEGQAVLFHTGWDRHWRTDEYASGNHPFLTAEAAQHLVSAGVKLVGIDSFNIDDTSTGERPAHTILLRHGIPIVEHMRGLEELPDDGFRFFAVPVKIRGFGSFPVRAFAIID